MPRGLALGSVSAICGKPVLDEKRTVIGVNEALKCGAEVKDEASAVGVKVPVRRCPFACAVRDVVSALVGNKANRYLGCSQHRGSCADRGVFGSEDHLVWATHWVQD
jgi:hypothetical protein